MRTAFLAACLGLLTAAGAVAQSKNPTPTEQPKLLAVVTTNKTDAQVVARTNRLTEKMARQLRLNNYQTNRLRRINLEKVARMAEIERQHAADPKRLETDCRGVCDEKDREIRGLLSTAQYNDYYDSRNDFFHYDRQFLTTGVKSGDAGPSYAVPGNTADVDRSPAPVLRQAPKARQAEQPNGQ